LKGTTRFSEIFCRYVVALTCLMLALLLGVVDIA